MPQRTWANFLVGLLLLCGTAWVAWRASVMSARYARNFSPAVSSPPISELDPAFAKILTLGHHGLFENFANIWMIQIYTDKLALSDYKEEVRSISQIVAKHNIRIESFYLYACIVMFSELNQPGECEKFSQAGLSVFPLSWRIPMMQGFVLNFKMQEPARAAAYYAIAASRKDSPAYVIGVAKKLLAKEHVSAEELERMRMELKDFPGSEVFAHLVEEAAATIPKSPAEQKKDPKP